MSYEKFGKMSGYMEKRGKLSITGRWKKWWCVLEGQLLLYYKSRIEYVNLSPCCGSLNMALVKNVQPHVGYQIHIMTHSQLIILRTKNKEKQQQWFYALVGVLPQNGYLSPLLYFTSSSIEYRRKSDRKKKKAKHKLFQESIKVTEYNESSFAKLDNPSPESSSKESPCSVFGNHSLAEIQKISTNQELKQFCATKISNSLECIFKQSNHVRSSIKYCSEINIRRYSSYQNVITNSQNEKAVNRRSTSCECIFTERRMRSVEQFNLLESNSIRSTEESQRNNEYSNDLDESKKLERCKRESKNNTLSRRSFSFLKKMFKRKIENQNQSLVQTSCTRVIEELRSRPTTPVDTEINTADSSVSSALEENIHTCTIENDEITCTQIEGPTIRDNSVEENIANVNSNNGTESESLEAENDIVGVSDTQPEEKLPDLPIKNGNRSFYIHHNFKDINSNYSTEITTIDEVGTGPLISIDDKTNPSMELDSLLIQLTAINNECDKSHESLEFHNNIIEDPDYDIPRPHTSLISETESISSSQNRNRMDFLQNNSVTNPKYESLSIDMAPDSLEMPWLLNDTKCNINYWTTKKEFDLCLDNDSGSEYDYHDSLNSNKYNS